MDALTLPLAFHLDIAKNEVATVIILVNQSFSAANPVELEWVSGNVGRGWHHW